MVKCKKDEMEKKINEDEYKYLNMIQGMISISLKVFGFVKRVKKKVFKKFIGGEFKVQLKMDLDKKI